MISWNKILNANTDKLAWMLSLPLLLSLIPALICYKVGLQYAALLFLIAGPACSFCLNSLYTTIMPYWVLGRKSPILLPLASVLAFLLFLGSLVHSVLYAPPSSYLLELTLLIVLLLEGIRAYKVSQLILSAEQRKGLFDALFLMWLVLNPIVGLWSYTERLRNLKTIPNNG